MADGADHEGLAVSSCHECRPRGLSGSVRREIGEFADVVDLRLSGLPAEFAPCLQESADQLFSGLRESAGGAVVDDRGFLPLEGDATEPCDQWFLAVSLHGGLEAGAWSTRRDDFGFVFGRNLGHG